MKGKMFLALLVLFMGSMLISSCGGAKYVEQQPPVPETEPVVQEPMPVPEPEPELTPGIEVLTLNTVYFDYDRSSIRADQRSTVAENAGLLESSADATVIVEGHCDERGTNEYNMALGQRRADSVKRYLMNYGIDPPRLTTVSYGEERPVNYGHDEDAWGKNRRAEFVVQQ